MKHIIMAMNPNKGPGPDGFSAGFHQKFRHIIGDDLPSDIQSFFTYGSLEQTITKTNLVVIPKCMLQNHHQNTY